MKDIYHLHAELQQSKELTLSRPIIAIILRKVVESCPVPIIVAGGKKIPERDAMQLTYDSIKGGAVGVDMGRNIWQSENPVPMIRAIRSIVHGNQM